MNKYMIKNCPCFNHKHQICNKKSKFVKCCDVKSCLFKQIVGRLKEAETWIQKEPVYAAFITQLWASAVLELLDIEECNNE